MKKFPLHFRLVLLAALLASPLAAQTTNTAVLPQPRDTNWVARHERFVVEAKAGNVEVLFLGDSITDFWRTTGKDIWATNFAPLKAANFGISGDRTQHVLWRMKNGELDGIKPKVVVLMIGTNNTGNEKNTDKPRNSTPEIIEGVTAVVKELRAKLPETKILLLAIFPRGQKGDPVRDQIAEVNAAIAKLDDGKWIKFLDINQRFLEPDGTLSKGVMPDLLHPNKHGYEIWAAAINGPLAEMLK